MPSQMMRRSPSGSRTSSMTASTIYCSRELSVKQSPTPDEPDDSLRNHVKIKGWQVLVIGNSRTPSDWSLIGAIFLSLEKQSNLGFRVLDYLPYDSYVRKIVGYPFAIRHGAKKIFDADDRGYVIDGDLGKHFDVDLIGESARKDVILQYSHDNPNRTVINPYIHFGLRL